MTDFLDGFIARRRRQVTRLGKLLDLLRTRSSSRRLFISLVGLDLAPSWMVVVIVAREFAVSALRSLAAAQNHVIAAWGLRQGEDGHADRRDLAADHLGAARFLQVAAPISLWLALVVTVYSGVEYYVRYGRLVLTGESKPRS